MAEDVLALILYGYETDSREIPKPSVPASITLNTNEFVNFIACDTMVYRKMYHSKAVKKTLTIPEWLNEAAIAMELGCDGVLMNTAIAAAQQPILMASAMRKAVEAGREAFLAGRMPRKRMANASSPETGYFFK